MTFIKGALSLLIDKVGSMPQAFPNSAHFLSGIVSPQASSSHKNTDYCDIFDSLEGNGRTQESIKTIIIRHGQDNFGKFPITRLDLRYEVPHYPGPGNTGDTMYCMLESSGGRDEYSGHVMINQSLETLERIAQILDLVVRQKGHVEKNDDTPAQNKLVFWHQNGPGAYAISICNPEASDTEPHLQLAELYFPSHHGRDRQRKIMEGVSIEINRILIQDPAYYLEQSSPAVIEEANLIPQS